MGRGIDWKGLHITHHCTCTFVRPQQQYRHCLFCRSRLVCCHLHMHVPVLALPCPTLTSPHLPFLSFKALRASSAARTDYTPTAALHPENLPLHVRSLAGSLTFRAREKWLLRTEPHCHGDGAGESHFGLFQIRLPVRSMGGGLKF